MTRTPREAFRDRLDGLDPEERIAFVEAVYDARGWETKRADGDLWVTPPGTENSRRVGGRPEDGTDADELRRMVLYAVDEAVRERLCRQFLGCDPSDLAGTAESGGDRDSTSTSNPESPGDGRERTIRHDATTAGAGRRQTGSAATPQDVEDRDERASGSGSDGDATAATGRGTGVADSDDAGGGDGDIDADASISTARWIAVGLALVVVVGGFVAAAGPGLTSSADEAPGDAGTNGTTADEAAVMTREGRPVAPDWRGVAANEDRTPPGVNSTTVTDASRLADAHEAALSEGTYHLDITYREYADGELRGVANERAAVASADRYRSRVHRLGALRHDSSVVASGSMYADGSTGYVRTGEGVRERTEIRPRISSSADSVGFTDRTERFVRWYLSVDHSRIVAVTDRSGTTHLRIAFASDPWPESRNVTGWARVDETGLVHELHREYTPASEPNVRIEVTIRIEPGPVTVTRPAWMEETTNGTHERPTPALTTPDGRLDGAEE